VVVAFLAAQVDAGVAYATISRRAATIDFCHALAHAMQRHTSISR
jgi:hypothetical protein